MRAILPLEQRAGCDRDVRRVLRQEIFEDDDELIGAPVGKRREQHGIYTVNSVVVAATTTASITAASAVRPRERRNTRTPYLMSCSSSSRGSQVRWSRHACFVRSTPPSSRSAAACAAAGSRPRRSKSL